jgi:putative oxidoreductase
MGEKREKLRDVGLLMLRLGIGIGIATHGYQKLFTDRMPGFVDAVSKLGLPFGQPATLAHLAAWSEFGGGLLIVAGLLTRFAALFVLGTMCVAFFVANASLSFSEPGRELSYVYLVAALALLLTGAGRFSLDHAVELAVRRGGK